MLEKFQVDLTGDSFSTPVNRDDGICRSYGACVSFWVWFLQRFRS